jgi:hypothetical protein
MVVLKNILMGNFYIEGIKAVNAPDILVSLSQGTQSLWRNRHLLVF